MGGVQGQKIHLKIRQDDLAVHVGRHGGGRVPRRRELNVHLGGRRRLLRPLSPWRPPPPPPGAEELAGKPADWRADDPAGGTAREALGTHALGNLQAPASPRRGRPDRKADVQAGRVSTAASQAEGRLRQRAPSSFQRQRERQGRGKPVNEQTGEPRGRLRLLRFLPSCCLRPWLASARAVAHFACHRGRKAALSGCHVIALLSRAGRATTAGGFLCARLGRRPVTAGV